MKNIIQKIITLSNKIGLMTESLVRIYRKGGYSTYNIAQIKYGQILKDKKVIVTGGGSGIGLSIAKKCLDEGATVLITGRNGIKLNDLSHELNNSELRFIEWDVSDVARSDRFIAEAEKILGGSIDVLVNNAGVLEVTQFPNITEEIWDSVYKTNSKGLFFLTQSLAKKWMINRNNQCKKIINISSQGGFVGATYPYRMTKWDVAGLTQGLGVSLAKHGIIVNGIAPGIIATDMQPDTLEEKDNAYSPHNPLRRIGLPEEIAELAVFLMSDAGNFIVGQTIICDGGFTLK